MPIVNASNGQHDINVADLASTIVGGSRPTNSLTASGVQNTTAVNSILALLKRSQAEQAARRNGLQPSGVVSGLQQYRP